MSNPIFDNTFPLGWEQRGESRVATIISVGELSIMLDDYFGDRIKFNLVKSRPELDGLEINDDQLQHLYVVLSELGWNIGKAAARDAWMSQAIKNEYSPVVNYLDGLLSDEGVVPVVLDEVAQEYLGATGPIDGKKVAAMLIGAVTRAYEPGSKFDNCLTLKGDQGVGKSSFFKALASPEWFVDTMQENKKDLQLALHNCWLFELQELESITGKQEVGKVKAMLTTSVDTFRQPFGFGVGNHPRRSIFVASVNRDDFLRDSTGNRRFWIVDLPQKREKGERIDVERIKVDRDRIWKAAVIAYKEGRKPILSLEEDIQADAEAKEYTLENWCIGVLHAWLSVRYQTGQLDRPWLPANHFLIDEAVAQVQHRASIQQVAEALKELGCIRHPQKRVRGQKLRLWESPYFDPLSKAEMAQQLQKSLAVLN